LSQASTGLVSIQINNVEVLKNHIILCIARDYSAISPVEGVYAGREHDLTVKMSVKTLNHL